MNDISYAQVAQEGLFVKKKTVDDLLATAQKKVSRLGTVEDVDAKLNAVNESGKQVNTVLRTMADAAKKRAAGTMDDKEFKQTIKEASKTIASPIKTLYAKLGNVVESSASVTSDEIKAFQSYLSGLKGLLTDRKKELVKASKESAAKESYNDIDDPELRAILESLESELDDVTEGCKKTCESDDEDCEDDDCDDKDDKDDEDEEDDDDDKEDDDEDDEDAEEACESFTKSELSDYVASCESMMNDDFGFEAVAEESTSVLNADGTLNLD